MSYLKTEAKQNERWRATLDGLPPDELADHLARIDSKDELIERLDKIVEESFASMGVPPQPSPTWPNVFERFRSLGLELEYRTVYAALSSQVHNDAEDLLNTWAVHCMAAPIPGMSATFHDLRRDEKRAFSWFCVTLAIRRFLPAAAAYLAAFELLEPGDERLVELGRVAEELTKAATKQLPQRPG